MQETWHPGEFYVKIFVYNLREYDEKAYFDRFCAAYGCEYAYTRESPSPKNAALARGCAGISIITTPMDAALLGRFHELGVKYVSTRSVGYDHIDLAAARGLGMRVACVQYSPESVANYAIMLMLMACRNIVHILDRARLQDYTLEGKIGKELSNCTVGVIGAGRIGRTVLAHLGGFGCRLLAYDSFPSEAASRLARFVPLETLLRESDIITLHAPSSEDTHHLIGRGAIAKMKDGVILVNTARGSLVDTAALLEGLDSRRIGFAALDVIENETGLYYHNRMNEAVGNRELEALRSRPNVILAPHTAFYTDAAVSDMARTTVEGLMGFEAAKENPFEVK